jgi:lipopolysaccharide transport system ATP-binding protein
MGETAISISGLGKRYTLGEGRPAASGNGSLLHRVFARAPRDDAADTLWALRDVSFEVQTGEVVGVIGRNGAGKSTLLKIMSRITRPTTGRALIAGRVGSLLEVGSGFHPELTGRENIYLNGAILGMSRAEIRRRFDGIVAFSEVERFLDTPVKRYSSGMYMRLAFAVAAHLEPEVLIVDEVLAVGDAQFQKKCLSKMGDAAQEGRTVLFVSHRMEAVRRLCSRVLLFESGRLVFDGEPREAIGRYLHNVDLHAFLDDRGAARDKPMHLRSARLLDSRDELRKTFARGDDAQVEVTYEINTDVSGAHVFARVLSADDLTIFSTGDCDVGGEPVSGARAPGLYRARFRLPTDLLNEGEYSITFALGVPFVAVYDGVGDAIRFNIEDPAARNGPGYLRARPGFIVRDIEWQTTEVSSHA